MVLESKAVLGFNLSFFADEHVLLKVYFDQIQTWLADGSLRVAKVTEYEMAEVAQAHELIQSGKSVGKIVCRTGMVEA
jgi:NADPH:quinone reductase-like Zn-dependent oxidoreductase